MTNDVLYFNGKKLVLNEIGGYIEPMADLVAKVKSHVDSSVDSSADPSININNYLLWKDEGHGFGSEGLPFKTSRSKSCVYELDSSAPVRIKITDEKKLIGVTPSIDSSIIFDKEDTTKDIDVSLYYTMSRSFTMPVKLDSLHYIELDKGSYTLELKKGIPNKLSIKKLNSDWYLYGVLTTSDSSVSIPLKYVSGRKGVLCAEIDSKNNIEFVLKNTKGDEIKGNGESIYDLTFSGDASTKDPFDTTTTALNISSLNKESIPLVACPPTSGVYPVSFKLNPGKWRIYVANLYYDSRVMRIEKLEAPETAEIINDPDKIVLSVPKKPKNYENILVPIRKSRKGRIFGLNHFSYDPKEEIKATENYALKFLGKNDVITYIKSLFKDEVTKVKNKTNTTHDAENRRAIEFQENSIFNFSPDTVLNEDIDYQKSSQLLNKYVETCKIAVSNMLDITIGNHNSFNRSIEDGKDAMNNMEKEPSLLDAYKVCLKAVQNGMSANLTDQNTSEIACTKRLNDSLTKIKEAGNKYMTEEIPRIAEKWNGSIKTTVDGKEKVVAKGSAVINVNKLSLLWSQTYPKLDTAQNEFLEGFATSEVMNYFKEVMIGPVCEVLAACLASMFIINYSGSKRDPNAKYNNPDILYWLTSVLKNQALVKKWLEGSDAEKDAIIAMYKKHNGTSSKNPSSVI